jgi:pimeloyl-ACP methyl ester carboxylesterase
VIRLKSGRIEVSLHALAEREGPTLLGVHALASDHSEFAEVAALWPGSVYALDLGGHGTSDRLRGGAYSAEDWAGDADVALRELGPACLVGSGVGAFSALLLAGARPQSVPGALLLPGRGLEANGEHPDATRAEADRDFLKECVRAAAEPETSGFDPIAIETLAHHRPREYARGFAEAANPLLLAEDGGERPPWWDELRGLPATRVVSSELDAALAELAKLAA